MDLYNFKTLEEIETYFNTKRSETDPKLDTPVINASDSLLPNGLLWKKSEIRSKNHKYNYDPSSCGIFQKNKDFTHEDWWHSETLQEPLVTHSWHSFWLYNEEIGRMLIESETLEESFIMVFEIAESHKRKGWGRKIISSIEEKYSQTSLTATAKDDDSGLFWKACGWTIKPGFGEALTLEGNSSSQGVYWRERIA